MTLKTFEGSWEDIQAHTDELTGHRVRVTVLDSAENHPQEQQRRSLADQLRGKVGTVEGASPDLSENTDKVFSDLMQENYPNRTHE